MQRVLIVDDDLDIQRLVSYNLSQAGFDVITASSGRKALESIQQQPPDIIMLTARGEEVDRVVGFELGADDYVAKPFSPRELVLRVKSIFRRMKEQRS